MCVRVSYFALSVFHLCYCLVVSTSATDCLERLVSEMTYYVSSGMLTLHTHSLTPIVLLFVNLMPFTNVRTHVLTKYINYSSPTVQGSVFASRRHT